MIGGLDERRLVKFGATTSDVRVRGAVIVPVDMQSVTLEAQFNNEETTVEDPAMVTEQFLEQEMDVADLET